KTVLERVHGQALKSGASSVTIATDSDVIYKAAQNFGAHVIMTASTHASGTDRIAAIVRQGLFERDAILVNVQGDEPMISPELIRQVAQGLVTSRAPVSTLCWPVETLTDLMSSHVVKVVRNCRKEALYFSRSPIPMHRDTPTSIEHCLRHIGLYAYRSDFLWHWAESSESLLERIEVLEQLRVLWAGFLIYVDDALVKPWQDINTMDDLERAREYIKTGVFHDALDQEMV
ncbi:MAG: 3-deoxy-manno-octulosonate cytidylyltransferase, partial [Legionellaceae bacterium]